VVVLVVAVKTEVQIPVVVVAVQEVVKPHPLLVQVAQELL
jgi:hypothetical protein